MKIIITILLEVLFIGLLSYQVNNYLYPRNGPELNNLIPVVTALGIIVLVIIGVIINIFLIKDTMLYYVLFFSISAPIIHWGFVMFYKKYDGFDYLQLCLNLTILSIIFFIYQIYRSISEVCKLFN